MYISNRLSGKYFILNSYHTNIVCLLAGLCLSDIFIYIFISYIFTISLGFLFTNTHGKLCCTYCLILPLGCFFCFLLSGASVFAEIVARGLIKILNVARHFGLTKYLLRFCK